MQTSHLSTPKSPVVKADGWAPDIGGPFDRSTADPVRRRKILIIYVVMLRVSRTYLFLARRTFQGTDELFSGNLRMPTPAFSLTLKSASMFSVPSSRSPFR